MKILFLDDDWTRHQSFKRQATYLLPADVEIHPVWTGEQARDIMLATPCFDALFLDHDLHEAQQFEHATGVPDVEPQGRWSGTEFVDWLVGDSGVVVPSKIVIHSWNRYGAFRMATTLVQRRNVTPRLHPFSDHTIADAGVKWLTGAP